MGSLLFVKYVLNSNQALQDEASGVIQHHLVYILWLEFILS